MDRINSILQGFAPISLDEMSRVRLMNRIDTKYVTTVPYLVRLLEMAGGEYSLQQIGGLCDIPYYTCYFDTPDRDMFAQHQRGRKARQKIRLRVYENSGTAFLEIKDKDNRGRTDKKRIPWTGTGEDIMPYSDFIRTHSHYMPESLAPPGAEPFSPHHAGQSSPDRVSHHRHRTMLLQRVHQVRVLVGRTCHHRAQTRREYPLARWGDAARTAHPSGRIQQVLRGHGAH